MISNTLLCLIKLIRYGFMVSTHRWSRVSLLRAAKAKILYTQRYFLVAHRRLLYLHTDHYSSTFAHKAKSGSIIMSSLRSKVDETRLRSRATPIAVEEEDSSSRMNLLPDVYIEYHATEKRKRDRAIAIDEDEPNKKSCKTSASSLIVSQDSTAQEDTASSKGDIEDMEYSLPCDGCGVSIVAKNKDDANKMKYLQSLNNRDESMQCTSCAYKEETDRAAYDLHYNSEYRACRVPRQQ